MKDHILSIHMVEQQLEKSAKSPGVYSINIPLTLQNANLSPLADHCLGSIFARKILEIE